MKIRQHRGSLRDAMETCVDIEPSLDALKAYIERVYEAMYFEPWHSIDVFLYANFLDERIGWPKTFMVKVNGYPFAYTDGAIRA